MACVAAPRLGFGARHFAADFVSRRLRGNPSFFSGTKTAGRVARSSSTLRSRGNAAPDIRGVLLENSLTWNGAASILGISPLRAWDFRSKRQPGGAPVEMTGDEFVDFALEPGLGDVEGRRALERRHPQRYLFRKIDIAHACEKRPCRVSTCRPSPVPLCCHPRAIEG